MALKAILETLDGLSDDIRKEYKQGAGDLAGKFILDVTPTNDFALENVKGLKSALSKERTDREDAERKLKGFDGLDADKAREALKKIEDMANWKPDDKVKEQIEAIKNQLAEKHSGELSKKEESIQSLTKQLEKVMVEASAIKAISEHKGSAALLLPHVKAATRMRQADTGEHVVEVLDPNGNPRISPAANSTALMTIDELVAEMKASDTFAPAFAGTGATGSGATGGSKTNASPDISQMSPTEKLRYGRQQKKT